MPTGGSAGDDAMVGNFSKNTIEFQWFFWGVESDNPLSENYKAPYNKRPSVSIFSNSMHQFDWIRESGEISQNKG